MHYCMYQYIYLSPPYLIGCWFRVSKCSNDPAAIGTYRDMYGESHAHAGTNETMCFKRAVSQWKYCGSHPNEQISVTFGPTGRYRGSYMSDHVSLNLINELRKRDKMQGLQRVY